MKHLLIIWQPRNLMVLSLFNLDSVVRGHHSSKDIWTPVEGETLPCVRETAYFVIKTPTAAVLQYQHCHMEIIRTNHTMCA